MSRGAVGAPTVISKRKRSLRELKDQARGKRKRQAAQERRWSGRSGKVTVRQATDDERAKFQIVGAGKRR